MAIHAATQKVIDYPDTLGKRSALKHFHWNSLDKTEEVVISYRLLDLAATIDSETSLHAEGITAAFELVNERIGDIEQNLVHSDGNELLEHKDAWVDELELLNKSSSFLTTL